MKTAAYTPTRADAPALAAWILTIRYTDSGSYDRWIALGANAAAAGYRLAIDLGRDFLVVASSRVSADTPARLPVAPAVRR